MEGSFADNKHPYAAHGPWLHILVEDDFLETLITNLEELTRINKINTNQQGTVNNNKYFIVVCICRLYYQKDMTGNTRTLQFQLLQIVTHNRKYI